MKITDQVSANRRLRWAAGTIHLVRPASCGGSHACRTETGAHRPDEARGWVQIAVDSAKPG
jgi:hypothetical protein